MGQELKVGKTLSEFFGGMFISTVKLFINPIIFITIHTWNSVKWETVPKVGKIGCRGIDLL